MSFKTIRLGVNIDHFATLRNQRTEKYIHLNEIVEILKINEINSITVHLREDRRHIKDKDVIELVNNEILPINLEMAATKEMQDICKNVRPFACCIVPEKRSELTTEGGLNVKKNFPKLKKILTEIKKIRIRTSLFIDPNFDQIELASKLGVDAIEIHTGRYANLFDNGNYTKELDQIIKASEFAKKLGMEVHAGHGLNLRNVKNIIDIKSISELNIGYSIVVESIFIGLENVIGKYKDLMD